jgi:hypothetical protein
MLDMQLRCFHCVVICVLRMSVRGMCVVSGCFVIARLVVFRGVAMMLCCAVVMLRCLMVVFGLFRHVISSSRLFRVRELHASSLVLLLCEMDMNFMQSLDTRLLLLL